MGTIISAVATKGGAGKSTLILTLAHSKPFAGSSCCVLDIDPQSSIKDWRDTREESGLKGKTADVFHVEDEDDIKPELERLFNEYDYVFIDLPGESIPGIRTRIAMMYSDIVILPVKTGEFDFLSTGKKLLPILDQAKEISQAKFLLIPSMIHVSSNKEKIIELFDGTPAKCLSVFFPERKVFSNFLSGGYTLKEYAKIGAKRARQQAIKAEKEIDQIAAEILKYIKK